MAEKGQRIMYFATSDLRDSYKTRSGDRISSMCKAIGKSTQSQISGQILRDGTVRFEIIGKKIKTANKYICREFCKYSAYAKYGMDLPVEVRSSQKARQMFSKETQIKLLKEGTRPCLLTEAALTKHNLLTGAAELREFACGPCDHYWWKVVLISKAVSKCHRCQFKYDALPYDKQFGIGRYICENKECKHTFHCKCHATQEVRCRKCMGIVRKPYIHPKLRHEGKMRALGPTFGSTHDQPNVINPSTRHIPTGSTVSTFLTQQTTVSDLDVSPSTAVMEEVLALSNSYSDDDEDSMSDTASTTSTCPSDSYDTDQGSLIAQCSSSSSDSEGDDSPRGHRRSTATDSSSSSSGSDGSSDDSGENDPISSDSGFDKCSIQASAIDSGLDTASEAYTRSSIGSVSPLSTGNGSEASSGNFNPLHMATIKQGYPGVLFSRHCSQQDVNSNGALIEGEGIVVKIPPKAILPGDQVPVAIQACLKGPFKLPRGYTPASPVYLLYPPCAFHEKVEVTADLFADLETEDECRDMLFLTSSDKPHIRRKQQDAVWRFNIEDANVYCQPGSQKSTVQLGHFCLGIFARLKKRNQRNRYLVSWYTPSVLLPTCYAFFSASLHHEVYTKNLESYLEKKFPSEKFHDTHSPTCLTDDAVQLIIPEDVEQSISISSPVNPCRISKKDIDLPLKHKRLAKENVSTYPPRIRLTIHCDHSSYSPSRPLKCSGFQVVGSEASISYSLSLSPSPSLSGRSSQSDSIEAIAAPPMTYRQLIQDVGINEEQLKLQCSKDHLTKIAGIIPNWLKLSRALGISEADILGIRDDCLLDPVMKAQKVLAIWHRAKLFMATYEKLVTACLDHGDGTSAKEICKLRLEGLAV